MNIKKLLLIGLWSSLGLASSAFAVDNDWVDRALKLQRSLDHDVPIVTNSILGSHNSYNSQSYRSLDRYIDPQQRHSIPKQLDLGARFIELDVHYTYRLEQFGNDLLLCHGTSNHVGCGIRDRYVAEAMEEIKSWLNRNPNEVIILYTEDSSDGRHRQLTDLINRRIANKIYKSNGCRGIPRTLTKKAMLDQGKQVIWWNDGGCSSDSAMRSTAFTSLGGMRRIWEDRTILGQLGATFGDYDPNNFTANDIASAFKNNYQLVNVDNLDADGRRAAAIWSWGIGEPNNVGNEDCAEQRGDGRWNDISCSSQRAYACNKSNTNLWKVVGFGAWSGGVATCRALGDGYEFAVPTNSTSNEALRKVKPGRNAWVAYNDSTQEGNWIKGSDTDNNEYRALRNVRSGMCLDVAGGSTALGANVQVWGCNGSNAQKWKYESSTGLLRSAVHPNRCLDNRGQNYNGGEIVLWECSLHRNLKFDWVGSTLRTRNNGNIAVDAAGSAHSGANVLQWTYHGETNQQWEWR